MLKDRLRQNCQLEVTEFDVGYNSALADVENFLEENKGEWEVVEPQTRFERTKFLCSSCGGISSAETAFCPHCGIKMR